MGPCSSIIMLDEETVSVVNLMVRSVGVTCSGGTLVGVEC